MYLLHINLLYKHFHKRVSSRFHKRVSSSFTNYPQEEIYPSWFCVGTATSAPGSTGISFTQSTNDLPKCNNFWGSRTFQGFSIFSP